MTKQILIFFINLLLLLTSSSCTIPIINIIQNKIHKIQESNTLLILMNNIKSNSQLKQKKNIKKIKFNIKEHNNTYSNIKTINLIWPIKKPVLFRYFNSNKKNIYNGIALGAPSGTKVFAALYGKVLYTGKQFNCFGNIIILQHSDFLVTIYGNLSHIYVQSGMNIQQNQSIGIVGCTGNVESPRIHFEVRYHGYPIDPLILLKKMQ